MQTHHAGFALMLASCAPALAEGDYPPVQVASSDPTAVGTTAASATKEGATPALGDFNVVFERETGDWTNQIVIAPWGDVIAIGGHNLRVLARDTGKELFSTPICLTQSVDAAAFVDDSRLLISCKEHVEEVTFPAGTVRQAFKFSVRMDKGAIGGGRIAVGADGFLSKGNNHVTVYDAATFGVVDELDASGKIEAITVSADGSIVAVGTDGAGIDVRDIKTKQTKTHLKGDGDRHSAVRLSPDGKRLFTDTGSFVGGEIDLATGKITSSFKSGSWLRAMRYLSADAVLATGSDGLVLYAGKGSVTRAPVRDLGEGLDLSRDKTFFCAAGRSGDVACFSTKPVPPSTFTAKTSPPSNGPGSSGSTSSPPLKATEIEGELLSRVGKTLTLQVKDTAGLSVGKRGELLKRFEQNIGFKITGFISVADFEVKSVTGDKVVLAILKETSEVTANGKKVNQFTPKSAMKLVFAP